MGKVLANCPHVKGMIQRYTEKLEWHETSYKQLHKTWYQEINSGRHKNKSFKQFYENRLKTWDEIFDEIKTSGYRKSDLDQDNAEVAIDSHGHYLLIDGRHRVAFAQILGVKKIPVVVNIISENSPSLISLKTRWNYQSIKTLLKRFLITNLSSSNNWTRKASKTALPSPPCAINSHSKRNQRSALIFQVESNQKPTRSAILYQGISCLHFPYRHRRQSLSRKIETAG